MTSSTIGTTKFFKGHSLLLPGKAERYNEKPSIVAPKLTSSASALSSRLRAFLPELAAANEALAKRLLDEGPKAVDMNIKVLTCNNAEDDDEEDEEDEIDDDDDVNEKDREGMKVDSSVPEMPIGPKIEMNISIHELLSGSVLDNDDNGDDDNNDDGYDKDEIEEEKELMQSAAKRRVLIEEVDSTVADSRRRRTREEDSVVFEEASVKAKRVCQEMT
jgi:hypothetical protein